MSTFELLELKSNIIKSMKAKIFVRFEIRYNSIHITKIPRKYQVEKSFCYRELAAYNTFVHNIYNTYPKSILKSSSPSSTQLSG
jgi:hypothetical protein